MKIFNNDKVYVQIKDFTDIIEIENVPKSVLSKLINGYRIFVISEKNRDSFLEFETQEEIEFFKNQEWIVDFKKCNNLNSNELTYLINSNILHSKIENQKLLDHYLSSLYELVNWKKGKVNIPFPLEPDTDKTPLIQTDKYFAIQGVNPNILIIGKNDGSIIEENDFLTPNIVTNGISISLNAIRDNNPYFTDFIVERKFSKDNQYYTIEYHQKPYKEKNQEEEKKPTSWLQLILRRKNKAK